MSSGRIVQLTALREIRARMTTRAFQIGTALMVAVVVGVVVVISLVSGGSSSDTVGVPAQDRDLAALVRTTANALGEDVETTPVDRAAAGVDQVRDGKLDAFIVPGRNGLRVVVDQKLDDGLETTLNAVARQRALNEQVARLGGDPAAVNRAVGSAGVQVTALDPEEEFASERLAIGIVVGVLVYLALLVYGQTVAQGVVEEKTSRVVELLLSTIRPWQLMAGKVLGIGVVGLAQLVVVLVAGLIAALAMGTLTLPASTAAGAVAWAVLWFLLGYFLYALGFAAVGALVSRQEDVGSVTSPLTMAIVIPYVIGVSVLPADPDNSLVAVLSVIPLFAPLLMPMRLAMGGVPVTEVVLALMLTVVLIVGLVRLAGRVYASAVMHTGGRVRVLEALRVSC